jgi:hypothetical protein
MVERIEGLPQGVRGVRVWGSLSREEYDETILPELQEAVREDPEIRYLLQVGPDFDGISAGALFEDAKEGARLLLEHPHWRRTAVVTEEQAILRAISLFGWLTPGDVKSFRLDEREAAAAWVAG